MRHQEQTRTWDEWQRETFEACEAAGCCSFWDPEQARQAWEAGWTPEWFAQFHHRCEQGEE